MTISGCGTNVYADVSTLYKAHEDHSVVKETFQNKFGCSK